MAKISGRLVAYIRVDVVPSGRLQFLLRLASQRRNNTVETKFLTLPA